MICSGLWTETLLEKDSGLGSSSDGRYPWATEIVTTSSEEQGGFNQGSGRPEALKPIVLPTPANHIGPGGG